MRYITSLIVAVLFAMSPVAKALSQPVSTIRPPNLSSLPAPYRAPSPRALRAGEPPASVSGSIFLLISAGDTKRGSGVEISTLMNGPELRDSLALLCRQHDVKVALVARRYSEQVAALTNLRSASLVLVSDSVQKLNAEKTSLQAQLRWLQQEMIGDVRTILTRMRFAKVEADVEGHYFLSGLPSGQYVLFSVFAILDKGKQWWVPMALQTGERVHRDLDPATAQDPESFCTLR